MIFIKILLVALGFYLTIIGVVGIFDYAMMGRFEIGPLLCIIFGVAAVALVILWGKLQKRSKKNLQERQVQPIDRMELMDKLTRRAKLSLPTLIAGILCGVLSPASMILMNLEMIETGSWLIFVFMGFMVAMIVLLVLYANRFGPCAACLNMLKAQGRSLESCLAGIETAPLLPTGQIICGENAMYFKKYNMVLPYDMVGWIYKKNYSVYGVGVGSNIVIHTLNKKMFELHMRDEELQWLLSNRGEKFSKDMVIGYGNRQNAAYKIMTKRYKENLKQQNNRL